MAPSHGSFVWHELMTSDPAAARAYYGNVVGWSAQSSPVPGMDYWILKAAEIPVCGQLGGVVYRAPQDIPHVGRFAIIGDPQGAMLALFRFASPMPGEPPAPGTHGHVGWNELYAVDWEKAFAFYSDMFGWRKDQALNLGQMGTYQLFAHGEHAIGGMMNKPAQMPMPAWTFYFNVDDIDAAVERARTGGGQIINGPMQVPGGSWIAQALDPQGAMFALAGKRA